MAENSFSRAKHTARFKISRFPVTCLVTALTILGFALFQPSDIEGFARLPLWLNAGLYPVKLVLGSFLHVSFYHLLSNLAIWVFAGIYVETEVGSWRFIALTLAATLTGGVLETIWAGSKFIGLSGACYGLIGFVIWQKFAENKGVQGAVIGVIAAALFAVADTAFNWVASPDQVAYTAHIGGVMAGFLSSLGLNKLGTGSGPNRVFRPMIETDIAPILEIIYDHDEDDGEDAEAAFANTLDNKYVMEFEGRVMGMTGFRADIDTQNAAWLSYTYVHDYFRKNGNAYWMMIELRKILQDSGVERLFIATSDYVDEDTGEDIYLAARNFYEHKLNAEREIRIDNFYAPGESKYIYSLPVSSRSAPKTTPHEDAKARFVGLDVASESETSYVALWQDDPMDDTLPPSNLETKTLEALIDEVKSYSGKALFVTLPDYISQRHSSELLAKGFSDIGTLRDYYAKDVGEVHWGLYFD